MNTSPGQFRNHNDALLALIQGNDLSPEEVISHLYDDTGSFNIDEGPLHDFKAEYPFSSSDNYFGSILRLICAFHNSYGGVIIFGVHDSLRTAGKNKVIVDSEKINRKLRETLSRRIEISTSTIETPSGSVQIVVVPARAPMDTPISPTKKIGKYEPGTIYIRKGAEVLEAMGADIPFLYSDRVSAFSDNDGAEISISASLPPSPATIQEFVGRFSAIGKVMDWIRSSRDPRHFLWGQGGSGKSTIAYECASLLANSGSALTNYSGNPLDRVIYISGKAIYLDPHSGKTVDINNRDFTSATDIFRSILVLSDWAPEDQVSQYTHEEALNFLDELFEIETQVIVIDDIDTLTTSNKDGGMEELLLALSRSKSGSKVLYTQRNFPSFAPNAAIEVPGLNRDELNRFIELCSEKFSVPMPSKLEQSTISDMSEDRPLAVETIIGMRRITSSYTSAFERWIENSSEARSYLFSREYAQLSHDDRARHVLAALSLFDTPQSFETLLSILQFSRSQLEDAIAETRDMFLKVSSGEAMGGDRYSIGAATRLFISETSQQLDRYASIAARISHFKTQSQKMPAAFVPLIDRASRVLKNGSAYDAISLLTKKELPPAFKEYPEVKALLGRAYANLTPPNAIDARACFEAAFSLGHRDFGMYLAWLDLEKVNRTELANGIKVCERVVGTSGFDARTKANFLKRLARLQALSANEFELSSPERSNKLRRDCVTNNISAFITARDAKEPGLLSYRDRANEAISIYLRRSLKVDDFDAFFGLFEHCVSQTFNIDELADTLTGRLSELRTRTPKNPKAVIAQLNRLLRLINDSGSSTLNAAMKDNMRAEVRRALDQVRAVQTN